MMRKTDVFSFLGALAMLATSGATVAVSTYPQAAYAQTQGMQRRDERRDTRQSARVEKQACKAGDKSRAECRQEKRDTKQAGRRD